MTYPNNLIDKRVVKRFIQKGLVDKAELAKQIAALPDMESNAMAAMSDEAEEADGESETEADADATAEAAEPDALEPPALLE